MSASAARGDVNGKQVNFFLQVIVNETNVVQALERFRGNRWVVALEYVGDPSFLSAVDVGQQLVLVTRTADTVDMNVDFALSGLPATVRVVFELPETYSDMKTILEYSLKYANISFDGGNFIRLDGCKLGAVRASDLPKKVAESRIPLTTKGSASIYQTLYIDDLDTVEFYESKLTVVEKRVRSSGNKTGGQKKSPTPKKKMSSLVPVQAVGRLDNF
jgi:hypothetical protein